jgi:hypothetical protein
MPGRGDCSLTGYGPDPSTAVSIMICGPRVARWPVVRLRTAPQPAGAVAAPADGTCSSSFLFALHRCLREVIRTRCRSGLNSALRQGSRRGLELSGVPATGQHHPVTSPGRRIVAGNTRRGPKQPAFRYQSISAVTKSPLCQTAQCLSGALEFPVNLFGQLPVAQELGASALMKVSVQ